MTNTPIYNELAVKYGWVTTTKHRWYQLLATVRKA